LAAVVVSADSVAPAAVRPAAVVVSALVRPAVVRPAVVRQAAVPAGLAWAHSAVLVQRPVAADPRPRR
jgi:hypothetical protein